MTSLQLTSANGQQRFTPKMRVAAAGGTARAHQADLTDLDSDYGLLWLMTDRGRVPEPRLRVASFNTLSPLVADWPRRRDVVRRVIQSVDADIIALQEVNATDNRDHDIAYLLGADWHLGWHSNTSRDGVGLVLASRWPLTTIAERSPVLVAEVLAPPPFGALVVAHHKPVFQIGHEHERELQAVAAAEFIETVVAGTARHVVVLGDFDATPDSSSVRFWTGKQSLAGKSVSYHDIWEMLRPNESGYTFTPENPLVAEGDMFTAAARRIDYIFVRCSSFGPTLQPRVIDRIGMTASDGVQASDHYGVVAELAVPSRLPGTSK